MNKKLFSLIYGDQIRLAPKTKIIPSSSFSTLIEAEEALASIQTDAEKYRQQVIADCEKIKENAFKEGYEEGYKEWAQQLVHLEQQTQKAFTEAQQSIIPIALKAAKKIVGREIELSPDVIVDIISSNLKAVAQHKKIIIYVNQEDYTRVEKNKEKIRQLFEHLESFSIRARDDIAMGGCIIETEMGIINAQMDHRWMVLEKAFERLMQAAPNQLKDK